MSVNTVSAGSGINITATTGNVVVSNAGVIDISAGSGISVSTASQVVTITNDNYLLDGSGISIVSNVISNTGALDVSAGTGISVSIANQVATIATTGSTPLTDGSGISIVGGVISNTGVTALVGGLGFTVDGTPAQYGINYTNPYPDGPNNYVVFVPQEIDNPPSSAFFSLTGATQVGLGSSLFTNSAAIILTMSVNIVASSLFTIGSIGFQFRAIGNNTAANYPTYGAYNLIQTNYSRDATTSGNGPTVTMFLQNGVHYNAVPNTLDTYLVIQGWVQYTNPVSVTIWNGSVGSIQLMAIF